MSSGLPNNIEGDWYIDGTKITVTAAILNNTSGTNTGDQTNITGNAATATTATAVAAGSVVSASVGSNSGAGIIAQCLQGVLTTTATTSSSTMGDTGLTIAITPNAATSKVLVRAVMWVGAPATDAVRFQLVRGSTAIGIGDAASSRSRVSGETFNATDRLTCAVLEWIDSPAASTATTYKVQFANTSNANAVYLNRSSGDADLASVARAASTITVMEIR